MRKLTIIVLVLSGILTSSCSSRSDRISGTYISPLAYKSYSCDQITQEMGRISRRVQEVAGAQDKKASSDAVATGVGIVVFWPALFFLMSDDRKEELARLKGESEALEQVAIQKNCLTLLEQIERERKVGEENSKDSQYDTSTDY